MTLNWRIACLTVGNEHLFSRLITVVACFFIFSAAWFCLWSISLHLVERPELAALLFPFGLRLGLMLQCPRGYWPVLLGAEWLLVYWLAQEVALAHLPLLMIGSVLTLLPVALTSRYRHQRDWRTLFSGRGPHRRGATAIPALAGAGGSGMERATADPHGWSDAGPHLPGFLALSHQHYLAAAGTIAGIAAGKLARAASDLISAAVYRQSVAATGVTC